MAEYYQLCPKCKAMLLIPYALKPGMFYTCPNCWQQIQIKQVIKRINLHV